ncbi:6-phosphogluconolactonase [Aureococcus anophagefferens]|nr:6-phosphogluconolactonase [Aureococcus anophagefferens]
MRQRPCPAPSGAAARPDGAAQVVAADVDGDGDLDVLAANTGDDVPAWYENVDGAALSWTKRAISGDENYLYCLAAGDVDGDGDADIVSAQSLFAWYENSDGAGLDFVETSLSDIYSVTWVAPSVAPPVDVDGDGDVDLVAAFYAPYNQPNDVAWFENDGSQGFTMRTIDTTAENIKEIDVADVDGDGDLDALGVLRRLHGRLVRQRRRPDLREARGRGRAWAGFWAVVAVDIDGDGDVDVLSSAYWSDEIAWHENDGSQSFEEHVFDSDANRVAHVSAVDLDGDGDVDVLAAYDDQPVARADGRAGPAPTPRPTLSPAAAPRRGPPARADGGAGPAPTIPAPTTVAPTRDGGAAAAVGCEFCVGADGCGQLARQVDCEDAATVLGDPGSPFTALFGCITVTGHIPNITYDDDGADDASEPTMSCEGLEPEPTHAPTSPRYEVVGKMTFAGVSLEDAAEHEQVFVDAIADVAGVPPEDVSITSFAAAAARRRLDECEPCDGDSGCGNLHTADDCANAAEVLGDPGKVCAWTPCDAEDEDEEGDDTGSDDCEPCDGDSGCGNLYTADDCANAAEVLGDPGKVCAWTPCDGGDEEGGGDTAAVDVDYVIRSSTAATAACVDALAAATGDDVDAALATAAATAAADDVFEAATMTEKTDATAAAVATTTTTTTTTAAGWAWQNPMAKDVPRDL